MKRASATPAAANDADTRLTVDEAAMIAERLRGFAGQRGVRAAAIALKTTDYTILRALRRARMKPETVARLRTQLAARAGEPSATTLTTSEASALVSLIRIFGAARIARRFGAVPHTLDLAQRGVPIRRASLARIRWWLRVLASEPTFHASEVVQ